MYKSLYHHASWVERHAVGCEKEHEAVIGAHDNLTLLEIISNHVPLTSLGVNCADDVGYRN